MTYRKKQILWTILIVFALILIAGAVWYGIGYFRKKEAARRFLPAVGLEDMRENCVVMYGASWTDPLKYKDGYEFVHVDVPHDSGRKARDLIPDSWTWEEVSIEELNERLHIRVDTEAVWQDSMGGDTCRAWFFADNRSSDLPFDERDYYLGYYDGYQDIIHIYRGHHLYGLY